MEKLLSNHNHEYREEDREDETKEMGGGSNDKTTEREHKKFRTINFDLL